MMTSEAARWSELYDLVAFREKLGGPALIVPCLSDDMASPFVASPSEDLMFDDSTTTTSRDSLTGPNPRIAVDMDGQVLPVVRSPSNPYSDKIGIGRTRNCDIRIDHPSISRLHALLVPSADGWSVIDAGSSNGTHVNGCRLVKGKPEPITFGDVVIFGAVPTQFVEADKLYAALRRRR
jgi:hypothetical protein